ncbi:c-type cytochrome [Terracidiphilus gabretensis]|uniref:c-type cytochrome n=1 Tax=Terracidiphilus gabretensis TaxID=1577687 RepID=UPI00071B6EE0|nr:cytochrome c [Terracidiphilus gabretensis]
MRYQILPAVLFALAVVGSAQAPQPDQATPGSVLFHDNCAKCHGANLEGTKKGPALVEIRNKKHWTDEKITNRIVNGAGSKMPAFRDSLSSDQIQQLIAYLRADSRPAPQQ